MQEPQRYEITRSPVIPVDPLSPMLPASSFYTSPHHRSTDSISTMSYGGYDSDYDKTNNSIAPIYRHHSERDSYVPYKSSVYTDNSLTHNVIQPPRYIYPSVQPKEYSQGTLNPLHIHTISKTISIDTRFRDKFQTTTSSNFSIQLPTILRKVVSLKLSTYEIPNTFYSISSSYGNNFLYLKVNYQYPLGAASSTTKIIVIPDGNYSVSDLVNRINGILRPLNTDGSLKNASLTSSDSIFNCVQLVFDVTISGSGTGKITVETQDAPNFTYSSAISSIEMDYTLDVNGNPDSVSITSKLGWNLGYTKPSYAGATSYVSDTLPEISTMRYLYLAVDDFQKSVNNAYLGAFNNWILDNNIIARIPVNVPPFNVLFDNNLTQYTEPRRYFGPVDLQKLQVQLLDDHGRILDINNVNYSLCLTATCLNE